MSARAPSAGWLQDDRDASERRRRLARRAWAARLAAALAALSTRAWAQIPNPAPRPAAARAPEAAPCLERARELALGGLEFALSGRPELEDSFRRFNSAFATWPRVGRDRFAVRLSRDDGRATELAFDRRFARGTDSIERSVSVTSLPRDSAGRDGGASVALEAKRFVREVPSDPASEILAESARQSVLLVPPECVPVGSDASLTRVSPGPGVQRFVATKTATSRGSEPRTSSRLVGLEALRNARLAQTLSRDPRLIREPLRAFVFVDADAPDALLEIEPSPAREGAPRRRARVATFVGGRPVFEGTIAWSSDGQESSLETASFETKLVDEPAWRATRLDEAQGLDARLAMAVPESAFAAYASAPHEAPPIQVSLNRPLSYPNLAQYWSARALPPDSRHRWRYELSPATPAGDGLARTSPPVSSDDRWGRAELRSTRWIQAGLPEVAAAAARAAEGAGSRRDLAERVLAETSARLRFDGEMANGGVQALSTSEVLARGKGVCQHFANVFVAIARAAGLPSRIVTGARLRDGRAELHAWAEYEASDGGPWLPVEPQSASMEFPPGRYLPFAASAILDDPSDDEAVAAELGAFFELRGTIEPTPAPSGGPPVGATGTGAASRVQASP